MDGLSDEELLRFFELQELCSNDDPEDLYRVAQPYLKSKKDFDIFLFDFMDKKLRYGTENEQERRERESLTFAFTQHVPDPFGRPVQKNSRIISGEKRDESVKSTRKPSASTLWDNMESIEKGMEDLLDGILGPEIIAPDKVKSEEPDSESDEPVISSKARESDSDDSFHSLDGEPHDKNVSAAKTIVPNRGKDPYYLMQKMSMMHDERLRETKSFSEGELLRFQNSNTVGTADKDLISDRSEEFRRKIYDGDIEEELLSKTESIKPTKGNKDVKKEKNSSGEETENSTKNFSLFNGLIMKKKDNGIGGKPSDISEKKEKDGPSEAGESKDSSAPNESKAQVSNIIDFFFCQPQETSETSAVEKSKQDYEKLGAIPKKKNVSGTEKENGRPVSREGTSASPREPSNGTTQADRSETSLPPLGRNTVDKEISEGKMGFGKKEQVSRKKSEILVSGLKELEIPCCPFVYVVSDSFSPDFRLPKGNYFIANVFPNFENVGCQVLYHPLNSEEKKVDFSEKRIEPEPTSIKKTEVKQNPASSNLSSGIERPMYPSYSQALRNDDAGKAAGRSTSESKRPIYGQSYAPPVRYNYAGEHPGSSTFEHRKVENDKIPNAKIKGKIFCNTPLQSLKKEGDDRNDSADAYGAILQSVADDFKSYKKNDGQVKTSTGEDDPPSFDRRVFPGALQQNPTGSFAKELNRNRTGDADNDGNDFSFSRSGSKKFVVEDNVIKKEEQVENSSGSDDDNEAEEESDDSSEDRGSNLMAALRDLDPNYVKGKLKNCGGDIELQKKVIKKEVDRSLRSEIESEMIRAGYLRILKELPTRDPEYLLNKWTEIAGDNAAIDAFIESEKIKVQLEEIRNKLFSHLPLLGKEFLESKAKDFLFEPKELETFIAEEKKKMLIDQQYDVMQNRLPWVDQALLREKCEEFRGDAALAEEFIESKIAEQRKLEKRNTQLINMHIILPDADPEFLQQKYLEFAGNDDEVGADGQLGQAFNNFLYELLESKDYPKVQEDDPASRERTELWRRFVDNFDVKDFLSKVPNPEEYYCGSKGDNNKTDFGFVTKFLRSRYPESEVQHLERIFRERRCNLTNACAQLDSEMRPVEIMDVAFRNENIPASFLLEIVFILRRREIRDFVREEKELRNFKVAEARSRNSLLACACCFEDELLETDVTTCADGDIFCIDCVTRSVETKLSDGDTKFSCLTGNCSAEFTLAILEKILSGNLYGKVLRKKQSAEVTEARVPGLETCPSCDFSYIPTQNDQIFKCQNPECLRETCRKCKEVSHVPLRCEEVERPKDTQVRTEIEEKMTEALIRACPQCGKKFVKTDGCNKMTCTCGATSCYLCRKPVKDYSHFNGQGGDRFDLCPLFSNNEDIHVGEVRRVGVQARDEALRENPDLHLVHDPTQTL